jgi:hypothetical protein
MWDCKKIFDICFKKGHIDPDQAVSPSGINFVALRSIPKKLSTGIGTKTIRRCCLQLKRTNSELSKTKWTLHKEFPQHTHPMETQEMRGEGGGDLFRPCKRLMLGIVMPSCFPAPVQKCIRGLTDAERRFRVAKTERLKKTTH